MGAPLPHTLSGKLSLESAYFLIQGPLPRSPLTLSPHKCVTSSITFLFKKMFCPPWLCILETLNLSQNKGVHLLNQLLGSGSGTPRPVIGPVMTRRTPALQEVTDSGGSQSKEHVQAWKPTKAQAPFQIIEVRIPQTGHRQQNCWKPPSPWFWFEARIVIHGNNKYWRAFPLPVCAAGRHQSCWIRLFLNSHSTCFPQIAACINGKSPVVLLGCSTPPPVVHSLLHKDPLYSFELS